MSSLTDRLEMIITADGTAATREFQNIGASVEKDLGKAQSSSDKLGSTFIKAGAGMVVAGAGVIAVLAHMTSQYETHEQAELKLQNTMRNTPSLAGSNIKAFLDQAQALQQTTEASDVQIESSQALLGQFGLTQDQVLQLTPLVVDLSQKMGIDLDAAAKAVGKSVDGTTAGLKRYGIVVDDGGDKTKAYQATVDALSHTVGGFATQQGATFQGRLVEIKNQLGDIEAGVGKGATEAFSDMLKPVEALSVDFSKLSPATQDTIGKIGAFAGAGLIAAGGASVLIGSIIKMSANFSVAKDALVGFVTEMTLVDFATLALQGAAVAVAFVGIQKAIQIDDPHSENSLITQAQKLAGGSITGQLGVLQKQLKDAQNTWNNGFHVGDPGGFGFAMSDAVARAGNSIPKLKAAIKQLEDSEKSGGSAATYMAGTTDALGHSLTQTAQSQDETTQAYQKAESTVSTLTGQISAYFETLRGGLDAQVAYRQSVDDLSSSLKTNGATLDINTQAGRDNVAAVEKQADAIIAMGVQYVKNGGSVTDATNQTELYVATLDKQLTAAGLSTKQVLDYNAQLGLTPQGIATAFSQPGLTQAQSDASNLKGQYDALGQPITTQILADTGPAKAAIEALEWELSNELGNLETKYGLAPHVGYAQQAVGGQLGEGFTLLGEAGRPEMAHKQGSQVQIFTGHQTANLLDATKKAVMGGGQSVTEHIHVHIDGKEVAKVVRKAERVAR